MSINWNYSSSNLDDSEAKGTGLKQKRKKLLIYRGEEIFWSLLAQKVVTAVLQRNWTHLSGCACYFSLSRISYYCIWGQVIGQEDCCASAVEHFLHSLVPVALPAKTQEQTLQAWILMVYASQSMWTVQRWSDDRERPAEQGKCTGAGWSHSAHEARQTNFLLHLIVTKVFWSKG